MRLTLRRFEPADVERMRLAIPEANNWLGGRAEIGNMVHPATADFCWSALIGDRPFVAAGMAPVRAGTLHAWAFADVDLPCFAWRRVLVTMRSMLKLAHGLGWWRIECAVRLDYPQAQSLVEHLDFINEGLMLAYTPDRAAAILYAHIDGIST